MAYWCTSIYHISYALVFLKQALFTRPAGTYYAAQAGLDLKSHEAGAREYLLALITRLEKVCAFVMMLPYRVLTMCASR